MELNDFFEGIRMMPEAVQDVARLKIPEEVYQRKKRLFQEDKESFYQAVLKEKDFRIRFLYYFSRMACDTWDCYLKRQIPERIYWDTFYDLTLWCGNCFRDFGEYGIDEYRWFFRHIECRIWRLGRLEFEQAQLTVEELEKGCDLQNTVSVLHIHIPQGEKLRISIVKESLHQAFERWGTQIPYVCHSWLLEPELVKILPADSNIIKFQKLFRIIRTDYDTYEAESRIFGCVYERAADYPEQTLLQRKAKRYLMEGGRLGSGFGVLNRAVICRTQSEIAKQSGKPMWQMTAAEDERASRTENISLSEEFD